MEYEKIFKILAFYSAFIGLLYFYFGLIQWLIFLKVLKNNLHFSADLMSGFTLLVIGGIYVSGVKRLLDGEIKGLSYPLVATILSLGVALLFLLILVANSIEYYVIGNEDYAGWTIIQDIRPELFLAPLSMPIIYLLWKLIIKEKLVKPI